jgi:hypothetical protein
MDFTNEAAGRLQSMSPNIFPLCWMCCVLYTNRLYLQLPAEASVLIGTSTAATATGRRIRAREYRAAFRPLGLYVVDKKLYSNTLCFNLPAETPVLIGTSAAGTGTGRRARGRAREYRTAYRPLCLYVVYKKLYSNTLCFNLPAETPVLIGTSAAGTGTGRRARGREYCPALQPVCLCAYN